MFQLLTQYLFQQKSLPVPSIGLFDLQPRDAVSNFTSHSVQPPGWDINFAPAKGTADITVGNQTPVSAASLEKLYDWLSSKLNISKEEAILQYDDFTGDLKTRLDRGDAVEWEGLGRLLKNDEDITFIQDEAIGSPFSAVTAKKVLRENASHAVLVGEKETTTGEMRRQYEENENVSRPRGRMIAWILFFVALALLGWYFVKNGCNMRSIGNQEKAEILKSPETYQLR